MDFGDDENNRHFVNNVLNSETNCILYLRQFGIFESAPHCRGRKTRQCGRIMEERSKNGTPIWRCPESKCSTFRSFASTNDFFVSNNGRRQIKLSDILQLSWLWCYSGMSYAQAAKAAGVSKDTVVNWFKVCRRVCGSSESALPKMIGTLEEPIQVDESYFSGRRKYNRGRMQRGDKSAPGEQQARQELVIELESWGSVDPSDDDGDEFSGRPTRKNNYGQRVVGPWVVGLYKSKKEVRFYIVPDRKGSTLLDIIGRCCAVGSVIRTDEWSGYSRLTQSGYIHKKVNHSEWFVNPHDGTHTQGIERMWVEGKAILKRHRRPTVMLQSHLDELSWRRRHSESTSTLLTCFWRDVFKVHDLSNIQ